MVVEGAKIVGVSNQECRHFFDKFQKSLFDYGDFCVSEVRGEEAFAVRELFLEKIYDNLGKFVECESKFRK